MEILVALTKRPVGLACAAAGAIKEQLFGLLLTAAFLTLSVGLSHGAGILFSVAGRCEMPLCLWGSDRLRASADELKYWHPEAGHYLLN